MHAGHDKSGEIHVDFCSSQVSGNTECLYTMKWILILQFLHHVHSLIPHPPLPTVKSQDASIPLKLKQLDRLHPLIGQQLLDPPLLRSRPPLLDTPLLDTCPLLLSPHTPDTPSPLGSFPMGLSFLGLLLMDRQRWTFSFPKWGN